MAVFKLTLVFIALSSAAAFEPCNELCPRDQLKTKSFKSADVTGDSPLHLGTEADGLPESLQGIFWLQNQGDSSAIMSFGKTEDGGGHSTGKLEEGKSYDVRVGGDRCWAFQSKGESLALVEASDLVYQFKFNNVTSPTHFQIIPKGRIGFIKIDFTWTWLLSFTMTLYEHHPVYNDSVVWSRDSSFAGQELGDQQYDLVQIIDGSGKKLQAFKTWVEYSNSQSNTNEGVGEIWYHESDGCTDCGSPASRASVVSILSLASIATSTWALTCAF